MKVILSRKGFDSKYDGCPSPILPDGTLLSMPIPSDDRDAYSDLCCHDINYADLLRQLRPKKEYSHCHVDPDLQPSLRTSSVDGWMPAFGQTDAARGVHKNAGVEVGDLFLFFGWFRQAELGPNGYRFARKSDDFYRYANLQVIYGYLQIGKILTDPKEIAKYHWHPHASQKYLENHANTLYLPAEHLSWDPQRNGYGTLNYRPDRVLTLENKGRATWKEKPFLMPEHVYGNRKNSAKGAGIYYAGVWQELVLDESDGLLDWAKSIIE